MTADPLGALPRGFSEKQAARETLAKHVYSSFPCAFSHPLLRINLKTVARIDYLILIRNDEDKEGESLCGRRRDRGR